MVGLDLAMVPIDNSVHRTTVASISVNNTARNRLIPRIQNLKNPRIEGENYVEGSSCPNDLFIAMRKRFKGGPSDALSRIRFEALVREENKEAPSLFFEIAHVASCNNGDFIDIITIFKNILLCGASVSAYYSFRFRRYVRSEQPKVLGDSSTFKDRDMVNRG